MNWAPINWGAISVEDFLVRNLCGAGILGMNWEGQAHDRFYDDNAQTPILFCDLALQRRKDPLGEKLGDRLPDLQLVLHVRNDTGDDLSQLVVLFSRQYSS